MNMWFFLLRIKKHSLYLWIFDKTIADDFNTLTLIQIDNRFYAHSVFICPNESNKNVMPAIIKKQKKNN